MLKSMSFFLVHPTISHFGGVKGGGANKKIFWIDDFLFCSRIQKFRGKCHFHVFSMLKGRGESAIASIVNKWNFVQLGQKYITTDDHKLNYCCGLAYVSYLQIFSVFWKRKFSRVIFSTVESFWWNFKVVFWGIFKHFNLGKYQLNILKKGINHEEKPVVDLGISLMHVREWTLI